MFSYGVLFVAHAEKKNGWLTELVWAKELREREKMKKCLTSKSRIFKTPLLSGTS